jgi:hypothetical protein
MDRVIKHGRHRMRLNGRISVVAVGLVSFLLGIMLALDESLSTRGVLNLVGGGFAFIVGGIALPRKHLAAFVATVIIAARLSTCWFSGCRDA